MLSLVIALLALAVGPLLWTLGKRSQPLLELLDGFALVAICGLLAFHTLPHAYQVAGWPILVALALGLMLPTIIERWLHSSVAHAAHSFTLFLAIIGVATHAAIDGAALARADMHLDLAVILHRLPVGLTIWMLLRPRRPKTAVITLIAIGGATLVGYHAGSFLTNASPYFIGLFEALVAGALMHVVLHAPHHPEEVKGWHLAAGIGALLAIASLIFLQSHDQHAHHLHEHMHAHDASINHSLIHFFQIAEKTALPLLVAYLGASLLSAFMPRATINWLGKGHTLSQSLRGMLFGLPLPVCSCGVVPLYQGLIEKGVPTAAALAFLVATPEIGIDAIMLSIPLLGGSFTLIRLFAAAFVALFVGWIIGKNFKNTHREVSSPVVVTQSALEKLKKGIHSGFGGLVDNTAAWIILGIAIAAIGQDLLNPDLIKRSASWDIILVTLVGIPTYVCASGATPLVAMFLAKGLSPGAALAFLLTGPATNITTFGVLANLHGKKYALYFGLSVGILSISLGAIINLIFPVLSTPLMSSHHHHETSFLSYIFLGILVVLYTISLLRQGPRGFIAHVFKGATHGFGDSHHHHEHDHDHSNHHEDTYSPSCSSKDSNCDCGEIE